MSIREYATMTKEELSFKTSFNRKFFLEPKLSDTKCDTIINKKSAIISL